MQSIAGRITSSPSNDAAIFDAINIPNRDVGVKLLIQRASIPSAASSRVGLTRDEFGPAFKAPIEIKFVSLRTLFSKHLPPGASLDYMSMDLEGHELPALQSNDWSRFKPRVIVIEENRAYSHIIGNMAAQYINALANGDICLAVGWAGDAFRARNRARESGNGVDINYVIPREGALMSLDNLAIPKDAPHPEEAYKFIDFQIGRAHV